MLKGERSQEPRSWKLGDFLPRLLKIIVGRKPYRASAREALQGVHFKFLPLQKNDAHPLEVGHFALYYSMLYCPMKFVATLAKPVCL